MEVIFQIIPGVGGDIGKISLNRPQALNALNLSMCSAIHQQLQLWLIDPGIKAVMITGEGERAFCAGGDIRNLYEAIKNGCYEPALEFFQVEYAMNQALFEFPKPYIAFLHGVTMGGGVGISIHGSHTLTDDHLVWAMPETGIGFFPDVGVCYYLARMPHHIGYYLALTGEAINAQETYQLGITDAIIPKRLWPEVEKRLAETVFEGSGLETVSNILSSTQSTSSRTPDRVRRTAGSSSEYEHHLEPAVNPAIETQGRDDGSFLIHSVQIEQLFSLSSVQEIVAALANSSNPWAQNVAKKLLTRSPTSLEITFQHLQHCQKFDFKQTMDENRQIVKKIVKNHDLIEGIRAALIDKDRNPRWNPNSL